MGTNINAPDHACELPNKQYCRYVYSVASITDVTHVKRTVKTRRILVTSWPSHAHYLYATFSVHDHKKGKGHKNTLIFNYKHFQSLVCVLLFVIYISRFYLPLNSSAIFSKLFEIKQAVNVQPDCGVLRRCMVQHVWIIPEVSQFFCCCSWKTSSCTWGHISRSV